MERFVEADWRADLMNIREKQEQTEMELLSPYATQSIRTKGRKKPEVECEIRTCFQRDRDRIVHCKAFRRLKDKTQVFLSPVGDHYRTRLMHTLEVSQNARTIARALDLNETLTEAIALGHDLGHTPFGHAGERVLNEMNPAGFKHNEHEPLFLIMPKSAPKSMISPALEIPSPNMISNSALRKGGATLFFTTFTLVWLPITSSPSFS